MTFLFSTNILDYRSNRELSLSASRHVSRLIGTSQSHMMLAQDGYYYVVKFLNNPIHIRILANELFASGLAKAIGLSVPIGRVISVSKKLAAKTDELFICVGTAKYRVRHGLNFGSRLVGWPFPGYLLSPLQKEEFPDRLLAARAESYLPEGSLLRVRNLQEFAGVLAFDLWTGNRDYRQVLFSRDVNDDNYVATFIDHSHCFGAEEWAFEDARLAGAFSRDDVYRQVIGWETFEPWLTRIETMAPEDIRHIAQRIPSEWCGGPRAALERLVRDLIVRRGIVRKLIVKFRESSRAPFQNWSGI